MPLLCREEEVQLSGTLYERSTAHLGDSWSLQLKIQRSLPSKGKIHFRYDLAILIVSLTWHGTNVPFGDQLQGHMRRRYVGREEMVRFPTLYTVPIMNAGGTHR